MTPFAYAVPDYDNWEIYPTLDAVAAAYRDTPAWACQVTVYVYFADGSRTETNLHAYMEEREVDVAEVEVYIDQLREDARKRDAEYDAQCRAEGRLPITVTDPAPIYMLDRQCLIDGEINARKWVWKPLS